MDLGRNKEIIQILVKTYPNTKIALNYSNSWELLVAVILSAQCTDTRVNIVTKTLFKKYKDIKDFANANLNKFENDIRSTGFFRNKTMNIISSAKLILRKFKGDVSDSMTDLLTLPGVARKTANIILGNAFGKVEGIAVDTHVLRISQRLRLVDLNKINGKKVLKFKKGDVEIIDFIKNADPVKIEKELIQNIPKNLWFKITNMIIDHGRSICKAQNPKCDICPLGNLCAASRVN